MIDVYRRKSGTNKIDLIGRPLLVETLCFGYLSIDILIILNSNLGLFLRFLGTVWWLIASVHLLRVATYEGVNFGDNLSSVEAKKNGMGQG